MSQLSGDHIDLVPLGQAQRLCMQELGVSAAQFRHELAEHARGAAGIPWVADDTCAGVPRAALADFIRRRKTGDHPEDASHD